MRTFLPPPITVLVLCFATITLFRLATLPATAVLSGNEMEGTEFWIAVPPNDGAEQAKQALEIYVTSAYDAKVTLVDPETHAVVTRQITAFQPTTFTTKDFSVSWAWEVTDNEIRVNKGIYLTATKPVIVNVMNQKVVSSEGFTALPVQSWGKEYVHLGFWDFGEVREWGSGFLVVAAEENTHVSITLKGRNTSGMIGATAMGKGLGTTSNVILNKGQVFMVRGNGKTLGEFDISGTSIMASKPVGVISFHQRTMIPASPSPNNGRDHLVEMLPPVSAWGTEHITVQLHRGTNQGDFFRIIAAEDNTQFQCDYTDLVTSESFVWKGTLNKKGDFAERGNEFPSPSSIRGIARWTSDKPTFIMQYSYSNAVDNATRYDPFMMAVVPTQQYVSSGVFQTPSNSSFDEHWAHIVVRGDAVDMQQTLLKGITLDGKPLVDIYPALLVNHISGTDYYWAQVKVEPGVHEIKGEAPLSVVVYGTGSLVGYGWTAVTGSKSLATTDVAQEEATTSVQLYCAPTPAVDECTTTFVLPAHGDVRIELFDIKGVRLYDTPARMYGAGEHSVRIPTAALASGTYVLRLRFQGEVLNRSIVVQK